MSFVAILPSTGLLGWTYLRRSSEAQIARLAQTAEVQRDEAHFRERIGSIDTAEELVADRQLLKVALGAFGLGDDLNNRYFVQKVLEDGTLSTDALSTKLADKTYADLAGEFGFGDFDVPRTRLSDFADRIIERYRARSFEIAVGEQDDDLRLALNADRELEVLAAKSSSESTKWYSILGNEALRTVFETAFGLPASFGSIDLDQQVSVMKDRADRLFGSSDPAMFSESAAREKLVQRFLVQSEIAAIQSNRLQSGALQMLTQTVDFLRGLRTG